MTVSEHKKYFNRPRGYFHITSHRGGLIFIVKYLLTLFVNYLITLYKQNVVHVPKMARDNLSKYVVYSLHRKITAQNISFLPIFTSLFEKSTLFVCNALKLWRTQANYIKSTTSYTPIRREAGGFFRLLPDRRKRGGIRQAAAKRTCR